MHAIIVIHYHNKHKGVFMYMFTASPQCFSNGNIRLVGGASSKRGESGGVCQWDVGNCDQLSMGLQRSHSGV